MALLYTGYMYAKHKPLISLTLHSASPDHARRILNDIGDAKPFPRRYKIPQDDVALPAPPVVSGGPPAALRGASGGPPGEGGGAPPGDQFQPGRDPRYVT